LGVDDLDYAKLVQWQQELYDLRDGAEDAKEESRELPEMPFR
jgi:hypothetical protein